MPMKALGFLIAEEEMEVKLLPCPIRVKRRSRAPVKITAEQILREAHEAKKRPPKQKITDAEELDEYWLRRPKSSRIFLVCSVPSKCYKRAREQLGEDGLTEEPFAHFAEFEEKVQRVKESKLYLQNKEYALDHVPKGQAEDLYKSSVSFQKQIQEKIRRCDSGKLKVSGGEEHLEKDPLIMTLGFITQG
ncbi:hypothetical protein R1flu_003532 [Riccia fluitans]|uniref:Uncharacterized protein n=1 Tax=Riccia fluitans TaxID=41844 RepID=A0ABD1YCQ6_9MARC